MKIHIIAIVIIAVCANLFCGKSSGEKLRDAIWKGDIDSMNRLIDKGADVNGVDFNKETPIFHAIGMIWDGADKSRNLVMQVLIKRGADLEARDKIGRTPFLSAVQFDEPEECRLLKKSGADIHAIVLGGNDPYSAFGETAKGYDALFLAADSGSSHVLGFLVKECGFKINDESELFLVTPLQVAAGRMRPDAVKELLRLGASPKASRFGAAPLDYLYSKKAVYGDDEAYKKTERILKGL